MIRAFVGIPLPEDASRKLGAAQAGLPSGRPVPEENFHVTLAFLGEHPGPVIEDVHLELAAIRAPAFDLSIAGVGLFGDNRHRVLYAAVAPEPGLTHLREKVAQAARGAGVALPRARFTPHVTLARFNAGLAGEAAQEMRDFAARRMNVRAGPFAVEEFVLYRSTLGRNGPVYQEMAVYPMGGRGTS
ncbi:MAG TPA: RNA 2',3'-cyclic phosphodiesterase [Thermohalobaculum sp.]|nr:RNA 2',3'-cyclic phosphodiesterase [Thermohalobaculum sp.]